ncbi:MAG: chorion class high-cysteine HCB protein 13 [Lachnospiraceae bacterium]|nr:chorion class high-cysteine HCB protein 13 [Lachnospiraceae bacterium]
MSDLAATNCGCGSCEGGNNSCIWIILLLLFCGNGCGNGNGILGGNCGGGCDCSIIIIILLLVCCGNGNSIC